MAKLLDVVEGWTDELGPFTLKADDVAVDLTGMTVDLILKGKDGVALTIGVGQTRIDGTPTTGKVYYTPTAGALLNSLSPFTVHWKVTDGVGAVVFFPNGEADKIVVYKP